MKVLKGIGLFFVYPAMTMFFGFWCGVRSTHFFYPGDNVNEQQYTVEEFMRAEKSQGGEKREAAVEDEPDISDNTVRQVSAQKEVLAADTEYVMLETDIIRGSEVETSWKLPAQYIGMDMEQFIAALENYSSFPPLSEMERGFVNAEVVSFSRERVVVRMNYQYIQPGDGFYLAVDNNEVVVYLEDKETVYINTGILLETLPEEIQLEIIQMMYMEEEGNLYNFLETYSS